MEFEIEIPSHFLCPISLQLMHDPVTVSSGITYDRQSIELWLSTKHRKKNYVSVCPVTKQPIADLTPNHTLRRLIQSWCTLNSVDRIPTPKSVVRSTEAFASLAQKLVKSENQKEVVETLAVLAGIEASEDELRSIIRKGDELIDRLTLFLRASPLVYVEDVLTTSDPESRCNAIKLLRSLYNVADPNKLSAVKTELLIGAVNLLRERHVSSVKWALKLLFELNPWGRNRVKAVNAGATEALIEILLDYCGVDQRRVFELVMVVLDQLCACAEGRAGLVGHAAGLAVVSKRILRVSNVVSDRAVRVIGSVSRHLGNGVVLGEMLQVGVVAKLCLVVQVESSLKTKERAKEILSKNSRVWRSSPCVPSNLLRSFPT